MSIQKSAPPQRTEEGTTNRVAARSETNSVTSSVAQSDLPVKIIDRYYHPFSTLSSGLLAVQSNCNESRFLIEDEIPWLGVFFRAPSDAESEEIERIRDAVMDAHDRLDDMAKHVARTGMW